MEFNIQRQGRKWSRAEVEQKYHKLCPEKIELVEGKMFWNDEQRLNMLALLLENVGMDAAVSGCPRITSNFPGETDGLCGPIPVETWKSFVDGR
jgi:hypothetical protein